MGRSISVYIPEFIIEHYEKKAKAAKRSLSFVITEALDFYAESEKKEKKNERK